MLGLLCFDLDGTLADTERLKAQSYGWAAHRLRADVEPGAVEAAYLATCVGLSREAIATSLLHRFGLEGAARRHDGSVAPWQSYVGLRLDRYREMLADRALVQSVAVGPTVALARGAGAVARAAAVVTTSERRYTDLVLDALGLADVFDLVVTADDVPAVKPDPAGYRLALRRADVPAGAALTVEDSPAGIRGALAAGVPVLAVPSAYTREAVGAMAKAGELEPARVVAPEDLEGAVAAIARR